MRDAQMLILDEPTASLDARAEHEVFKRFVELTIDKCAVLISHRFSTVRMADELLYCIKAGYLSTDLMRNCWLQEVNMLVVSNASSRFVNKFFLS